MGHFVKKGVLRDLRYWIDRDLAATCEALTVAVRLVERDPLNAKRLKRSLGVPLRDRHWPKLAAVGLSDDKPSGAVNKGCIGLFFAWCVALSGFIVAALAR